MPERAPKKTLTGYCEPWSLRAGESITLRAACAQADQVALDIVRITSGDPGAKGPGLLETVVPAALPQTVALAPQILQPGSYGRAGLDGLGARASLTLACFFLATRPRGEQVLLALDNGSGTLCALILTDGVPMFATATARVALCTRAVSADRWYELTVSIDLDAGTLTAALSTAPTRSPGADLMAATDPAAISASIDCPSFADLTTVWFARAADGRYFDGRLARPCVDLDGDRLSWDFGRDQDTRTLHETSARACHGELYQLPARGVTGPDWDGSAQCWETRPDHYDAVHFHSDDLYDAQWPATAQLAVPASLPSGIYAFRLTRGQETDRIPFFVRPARGAVTADIALLMPTCTYLAYANHRMLFEGADFVAARSSLTPEHEYLRDHREVGLSCYEKHADGSGVMFSSRLRPVLQTRPGADRWNFTPDTCLNAFMEHLQLGHDIIADEDVHHDGADALAPYRVIVTGTHPEYWSTSMLDALETWQRGGGRLLYLGGNGFYWRVAFSPAWPGALELRRAEDGVRNWQTGPGESYHAFNGEYGGLWRRQARAPNRLVGVGFTAQGFERAGPFRRQPAAADPRAAWIFDGVADELIGSSGLGGGAAGQEIDRYDAALGSPPHALIVATATEFGPDMVRTKEEIEGAIVHHAQDPLVRADMVFYETPGGGAVFSASSIAWFGALARNGYDNDVATITANVLRRFADPTPFPSPAGTTDGA